MFEDSLMESQGRLTSTAQRWTTIASLTLQCSVAAAFVALPLFHPEILPFRTDTPTINLPLKPNPPRVPHIDATASHASPNAGSVPTVGHAAPIFDHLRPVTEITNDAPVFSDPIGTMGDPNALPAGIGNNPSGTGARINVAPATATRTGPLQISRGVSQGLLLEPIRPIYPSIAVSTRTEGIVIIEAVISKTGHIESVRATSGPVMLRAAAIDAVRNARYSPYLLNGTPTEVETTITVNFRLSA